jgi:hypothetical protein
MSRLEMMEMFWRRSAEGQACDMSGTRTVLRTKRPRHEDLSCMAASSGRGTETETWLFAKELW